MFLSFFSLFTGSWG
uniref:Uncharacterized protein n=1 Tax=Anguilla anguilla TaxID=7936 RepID=A0A0E9QFS9_ANGAN